MPTDFDERARRRALWPGRVATGQEPAQLDDVRARLASMWQLAVDAATACGQTLPDHDRADMPGRVFVRE